MIKNPSAKVHIFCWVLSVAVITPVGILLNNETALSRRNLGYHVAALVLARGGSKGIPRKNLALVGNKTLIAKTVETLRAVKNFSSVWVSTDDIDIAEEASKAGSLVYMRSSRYAADDSPSIDAVKEFISFHAEIDIIALCQCTSPFTNRMDLEHAYKMVTVFGYDSVFSATRSHNLRWKRNKDGSVKPVNFDLARRPRRQDFEGEFIENGMFYFARVSLILRKNVLQGGKMGIVEVPSNRSLEIDTEIDVHVANALVTMHTEL